MKRPQLPPYVIDTVVAVLLTVPTVGGLVADDEHVEQPWWLVVPIGALATLPLGARRYWPRVVLAVTAAAVAALNLLDVAAMPPGFAVAAYTVAAHCDRRAAAQAAVVTFAALTPAFVYSNDGNVGSFGFNLLFLAAAWILGDNLRTRRAYLRELEEKADRLEREREEHARRAAAEEQARIARELHDVIAHSVSVMVVQAAAGGEVFETNPQRAREALASVEQTGREALAELRRLLAADDGQGLAPQPGLARIDDLVDQVRASGLDVHLEVTGDRGDVPAGVDLSAYRVVQEALTNTRRHACAKQGTVRSAYGDDVTVEVVDDGAGPPATPSSGGRGLIGMRERVAVFGGEVEAGPRPEGGFRVRARFPVARAGA